MVKLEGRYREEMLGMLAVRVFLLGMEEYFQQHDKVDEENNVSCDNKGALTIFDKKSERIPATSSNADGRRALQELDRRSSARYKLEHAKGHQDRNKKFRCLTLESRVLNVECGIMAKQAVRASVKPGMGPSNQTLPLEKCSVIVGGEKQTPDRQRR